MSAGDYAREFGRAATSLIPVLGGPMQVVFENLFSSPLEKRRQAWLEQLCNVLSDIEKRVEGLTVERLASNEAFVTVAMQASQIAVRNHQEAKLEALRNAVLNAALPHPPHEDEQMIFLRLIDQLTPWHLRMLAVLANPAEWMNKHGLTNPNWSMGGVSAVIEYCLSDLRGKRDVYEQIVRDLQADGLVSQGQFLNMTMSGTGMIESRTTARGQRFIDFITEPL